MRTIPAFVMSWLKNLRLKSSNPEVRSKAVENLNGSGNSSDTEQLLASLTDESPQVRCAAIRALEKAHNQHSVSSMISALRDASAQVRAAATRALGSLRDVISVEPLVEALKDPDAAVRAAAANSLQGLGWIPLTEEEITLFEMASGKVNSAVTADETDPFIAEPMSGPAFKSAATEGSEHDGNHSEDLRLFVSGLADSNPGIRISAIHALAKVPGEEIKGKILKLFRDRDANVRLAAIQALANRNDLAPAFFLGLLDDPAPAIKMAAVQFLSRIHHGQIADALIPLLSDQEATVRQSAASALGEVKNSCAVESLVVSLIDEDSRVRQAAERALEQIDPNWVLSPPTQVARVQIESILSLCAPAARPGIQQVLARLPGPANNGFEAAPSVAANALPPA